jgi:hypothetical protein
MNYPAASSGTSLRVLNTQGARNITLSKFKAIFKGLVAKNCRGAK